MGGSGGSKILEDFETKAGNFFFRVFFRFGRFFFFFTKIFLRALFCGMRLRGKYSPYSFFLEQKHCFIFEKKNRKLRFLRKELFIFLFFSLKF